MKKRNNWIFIAVLSLIVSLCGCASTDTEKTSLGSSNTPEGKSVIVSVFASDPTYSWDFTTKKDSQMKEDILDYMGIATDYLIDVTKSYDKEASYIYDFEANEDLYYEATFDADTTKDDSATSEECMNEFLDENVDSDAIKEKYNADNIIYFMIVNTDYDNKAVTCTRNYYEGMEYPYEIVFLYNVDSQEVNCPAVYAHEIMHTFGDPDLYYEDEEYGLTKEFLDYVQKNMPNDLMLTCSDLDTGEYDYDKITNEVSELDAYYAGLTDSCDLVDEFNLNPSQHIK